MNPRPCLLALAFLAFVAAAHGQGSLTPPGPPGPTMKTLDQIEARTPIPGGATAYTISAPGSYYLTGNLTVASGDAITVNADNVTLDLGGFTVATTASTNPPQAGSGIQIADSRAGIVISHGQVRGPGLASGTTFSGGGFYSGIYGYSVTGVLVQDVTVQGCVYGILLKPGIAASTVRRCLVQNVSSTGISACAVENSSVNAISTGIYSIGVVSQCTATATTGTGIFAGTAADCYGSSSDTGAGISADTIQNCNGYANSGPGLFSFGAVLNSKGSCNTGYGIQAASVTNCVGFSSGANPGIGVSRTATGSYGASNSGFGLYTDGTASNCTGLSSTGVGLYALIVADNCYGTCEQNSTGLVASVAHNCYGASRTGTGLTFTKIGTSCYGVRTSTGLFNYVLGNGVGSQTNLP